MLGNRVTLVSSSADVKNAFRVRRRNTNYGYVTADRQSFMPPIDVVKTAWESNRPVFIPKLLEQRMSDFEQAIAQSFKLYAEIVEGNDIDELLDDAYYQQRLGDRFEMLSMRHDAADSQEIASLDFDVIENGELLYEDVWLRIAWLSFLSNDESLRFRFSFGMENFEDVSLDLPRQQAAAELCERIFPESALLSDNNALKEILTKATGASQFSLLERIIYFNAPNGGAQFHHDAEKGHVGVVYAQITGATLWLALSSQELATEIENYFAQEENLAEFSTLTDSKHQLQNILLAVNSRESINGLLNLTGGASLEMLFNNSKNFFSQLIKKDHAAVLEPGDIILLPQESANACAWHSVFCLGNSPGEALSFAVKIID